MAFAAEVVGKICSSGKKRGEKGSTGTEKRTFTHWIATKFKEVITLLQKEFYDLQ